MKDEKNTTYNQINNPTQININDNKNENSIETIGRKTSEILSDPDTPYNASKYINNFIKIILNTIVRSIAIIVLPLFFVILSGATVILSQKFTLEEIYYKYIEFINSVLTYVIPSAIEVMLPVVFFGFFIVLYLLITAYSIGKSFYKDNKAKQAETTWAIFVTGLSYVCYKYSRKP